MIRTAAALGIRTVAIHTDLDVERPARAGRRRRGARSPSYLDIDAVVAAAADVRRRRDPPGLRLPVRAGRRSPAPWRRPGITLVGPSADGDGPDGPQGRRPRDRGRGRRAGGAVVARSTRAADGASRCWSRPRPAAAARACGSSARPRSSPTRSPRPGARRSSAFGDDTMLVEKYVERGRHIEVQVLADDPRQRRAPLRAGLLDPAPAPEGARGGAGADDHRRGARAGHRGGGRAGARRSATSNAGTVEFLLDDDTGEAYFLEMNTRLQVEHPVTELPSTGRASTWSSCSCGSRPASRCRSPRTTSPSTATRSRPGSTPRTRSAASCRRPARPSSSAGRPARARRPRPRAGQVVSTAYDPMLGKVIAHGPDREAARRALVAALDDTAILGLTTNVGFLRALVGAPRSSATRPSTPPGSTAPTIDAARRRPGRGVVAAWVERDARPRHRPRRTRSAPTAGGSAADPRRRSSSSTGRCWSTGAAGTVDGVPRRGSVSAERPRGRRSTSTGAATGPWSNVQPARRRGRPTAASGFVFDRARPVRRPRPRAGDGTLLAPMPGTVLAVDVAEGDEVEEGQRLGVLEAMKMELALKAPVRRHGHRRSAPAR